MVAGHVCLCKPIDLLPEAAAWDIRNFGTKLRVRAVIDSDAASALVHFRCGFRRGLKASIEAGRAALDMLLEVPRLNARKLDPVIEFIRCEGEGSRTVSACEEISLAKPNSFCKRLKSVDAVSSSHHSEATVEPWERTVERRDGAKEATEYR